MSLQDEHDEAAEPEAPVTRASLGTVNDRLLAEINQSLGKSKMYEGAMRKEVETQAIDLNGVQPAMAFLGAGGAAAMSAGAWKLTNILAVIYFTQSQKYAASDVYIVQRLTGQ
jgi:hypothetical protein